MKLTGFCLAIAALLLPAVAAPVRAAEYSLSGATGLGYDSNAFLAPRHSYFDPVAGAVVTPERRGGLFVPLSLEGEYVRGEGRMLWVSSLDFRGDRYPQGELDNADTYRTDLASGVEYQLRRRGRFRDRLYFGPSYSYNRQFYFDRDTGLEQATRVGESLADRYKYQNYGLEAKLRVRTTPVRYALNAKVSRYDYEEVPRLSSLDYLYYRLDARGEYDIFAPTTIGLGAAYYVRRFEDRPPRDGAGNLVREGPDRKYSYYDFDLSLGQEVARGWKLFLEYDLLRREDDFVGYYDYTLHRYRFRSRYRVGGSKLDLVLSWWQRDYPRAFAFDDPAFPRKSYETLEAKVTGETPLRGVWKLWAEYEYVNQNSADPRYEYDRHQLAAGVKAEL